jgi:TIR domain-containing protein
MKIFVSYSRAELRKADELATALRNEGHTVFLDRDNLPAGEDFHSRIRKWIAEADLFIFLVSPGSVREDRYAAMELDLARAKWPAPKGHVLPVVVSPVEDALIPPYLLTVTVLKSGNVVPDTLRAVAALEKIATRRRATMLGSGLAVALVLAVGAWKVFSDPSPAHACYLSARIEPFTADSDLVLDTTYEQDTNSFLVTGEGIASINVGPLSSATAQWTLELRSGKGDSLGRQQVSGCPGSTSVPLSNDVHVTLTSR